MRVDGAAVAQDVIPVMIGSKSSKNEEQQADKTEATKPAAKSQPPSAEELKKAADFANNAMKMSNYKLQFVVPEKGSQIQVKVIDSDSGKVIREIPPDYMMNIAKDLQNHIDKACGVTVDELA